MKRGCILLTALLIVFCMGATALAETDFSALEDEELLAVRQGIEAELIARGIIGDGKDELYPGVYEVGREIRAGDFMFRLIGSSRTWVQLKLYASMEAYREDEEPEKEYVTSDLGATFNLLMKDGMVLVADDGVFAVWEREAVGWRP